MKRFILLAAIVAIPLATFAQKKRVMLFEEYTPGTIKIFNKSKIEVPLNYDASNKAMMYISGENEMILMNNDQVDSIFIGAHKFIYAQKSFLECIHLKNGIVYIDWSLKEVNRGYKGVYGQITQSKVESVNTANWQHGKFENQSTEVRSILNDNKYLFFLNGEMVTCKNKKNLLNLFKDKKELIDDYIKKHNIDFKEVSGALDLIDYCLSLK